MPIIAVEKVISPTKAKSSLALPGFSVEKIPLEKLDPNDPEKLKSLPLLEIEQALNTKIIEKLSQNQLPI